MYANGKDDPELLTSSLLQCVNECKRGYKRTIFLGSSKGGTCAIYYGLKNNASDIFAGVPQYFIGSYVNSKERVPVFKSMMGENAGEAEQTLLDSIMPRLLDENKHSLSKIHLLYSKAEHTYVEHIESMIVDFDKNHIQHIDTIESFTEHGDIGKYFSPWIKKQLNQIIDG